MDINTDRILFVSLPPINRWKDYSFTPKGVNYIKGYLDTVGIQSDIVSVEFDTFEEYYQFKFIFSMKHSFGKWLNTPEHKASIDKRVQEFVKTLGPYNVLAFSIFSHHSYDVFKLFWESLSQKIDLSKFKIIIGGNYLYLNSEEFYQYTDHVCVGPGEPFFQKLYGLDDFRLYSYNQYLADPIVMPSVFFGSGCVNKCIYCVNKLSTSKYYYRDIDDTIREIIHFKRRGATTFDLDHENMNNNYDILNEFIDKLWFFNTRGKLKWGGNFSPFNEHGRSYKEMNFRKLYASGNRRITMGVENISERIRAEQTQPKYTNEELYEFIDYVHDLEPRQNILMNFFTGYHTETTDDFEHGLEDFEYFIKNYGSKLHTVGLNMYVTTSEEDAGVLLDIDENGFWYKGDNTFTERQRRWKLMHDILVRYGIKIKSDFKRDVKFL